MPITGYLSTLPSDVLLNPAVIYVGSTPIGVTRGGNQFDSGFEIENVDFEGKQAPIKLLDRRFNGEPRISGTLIEFGDATTGNQIPKLEAGSANASAGTPNVTTVTPRVGGTFLSAGEYLSNLRLIWDRGVGMGNERYLALLLATALCIKYGPIQGEGSRGSASIPFEFAGRIDMATAAIGDAAYKIELREALP